MFLFLSSRPRRALSPQSRQPCPSYSSNVRVTRTRIYSQRMRVCMHVLHEASVMLLAWRSKTAPGCPFSRRQAGSRTARTSSPPAASGHPGIMGEEGADRETTANDGAGESLFLRAICPYAKQLPDRIQSRTRRHRFIVANNAPIKCRADVTRAHARIRKTKLNKTTE